MVVGSAATLIAALLTARCPNKWLAPPAPGTVQRAAGGGRSSPSRRWASPPAFPGVYAYNALTVGGGELIACFALGLPLLAALERAGVPERLAA